MERAYNKCTETAMAHKFSFDHGPSASAQRHHASAAAARETIARPALVAEQVILKALIPGKPVLLGAMQTSRVTKSFLHSPPGHVVHAALLYSVYVRYVESELQPPYLTYRSMPLS